MHVRDQNFRADLRSKIERMFKRVFVDLRN
jgi:hypothetical protein